MAGSWTQASGARDVTFWPKIHRNNKQCFGQKCIDLAAISTVLIKTMFFVCSISIVYPQIKHLVWSFNKKNDQCIKARFVCLFMIILTSVLR